MSVNLRLLTDNMTSPDNMQAIIACEHLPALDAPFDAPDDGNFIKFHVVRL